MKQNKTEKKNSLITKNTVRANVRQHNETRQNLTYVSISFLSYIYLISLSLFSQNILQIHKKQTCYVKGKIAKRPKEARKGLSTNLGGKNK